jgi:hypothetical protein
VHAPFVFAAGQRAGAIDGDLALTQRQRTVIQQAGGAKLGLGALVFRHDPEKHQRAASGPMIRSNFSLTSGA